MATKKKLSVAYELKELRLAVRLVLEKVATMELEMLNQKNERATTKIIPQSLPDFDLKTTMERDGGKCLRQYGNEKIPARIICTDRLSMCGNNLVVLVALPSGEYEQCDLFPLSGKVDQKQYLFTLPPPK